MSRPTISFMVSEVLIMWNQLSQEEKDKSGLLESSEEDLIQFHHSLGENIRNSFELWTYPWEPELVDGVDISPEHPDAISMEVIEKVWCILKNVEEEWNA